MTFHSFAPLFNHLKKYEEAVDCSRNAILLEKRAFGSKSELFMNSKAELIKALINCGRKEEADNEFITLGKEFSNAKNVNELVLLAELEYILGNKVQLDILEDLLESLFLKSNSMASKEKLDVIMIVAKSIKQFALDDRV